MRLVFLAIIGSLVFALPAVSGEEVIRPADLHFQRIAMAKAARSIVIPLKDDVFFAFDPELLNVHSVWKGERLKVPSFPVGSLDNRYLSDISGRLLISNPQLFAWTIGAPPRNMLSDMPVRPKFVGISNRDGKTTLVYDLPFSREGKTRVIETPFHMNINGLEVIGRRLEIGPAPDQLSHFVQCGTW